MAPESWHRNTYNIFRCSRLFSTWGPSAKTSGLPLVHKGHPGRFHKFVQTQIFDKGFRICQHSWSGLLGVQLTHTQPSCPAFGSFLPVIGWHPSHRLRIVGPKNSYHHAVGCWLWPLWSCGGDVSQHRRHEPGLEILLWHQSPQKQTRENNGIKSYFVESTSASVNLNVTTYVLTGHWVWQDWMVFKPFRSPLSVPESFQHLSQWYSISHLLLIRSSFVDRVGEKH